MQDFRMAMKILKKANTVETNDCSNIRLDRNGSEIDLNWLLNDFG
jgi:hypothetical protein